MSGIGHFRGVCEFCKHEVRSGDRGAFRIRGWELERQQGGANQVYGRERQPDRIAHAHCVVNATRQARKGLRDQMSLT